jgi:hypothetical protein
VFKWRRSAETPLRWVPNVLDSQESRNKVRIMKGMGNILSPITFVTTRSPPVFHFQFLDLWNNNEIDLCTRHFGHF